MLTADDIICYIPTYNDRDALERCLDKLDIMGIEALVVDGRFTDFPQINGSDYSTDGTTQMCEQRGAIVTVFPPAREEEKLNFALGRAHQMGYKVFMFCGSDAYYEADMPEFLLSLQRYYEQYAVEPTQLLVQTTEMQPDSKWNNTGTRQPRIILNYDKIEARHLHWAMFEKGARDDEPLRPVSEIVEGIHLYHDNSVRPKERDDMMTKYQDINVPRERRMFMEKIVPKAFDELRVVVWNKGDGTSYEQIRHDFLHSDTKPSHLIICNEGYGLDEDHSRLFEEVLESRNNKMEELEVISAVWRSKTAKNNVTLDPEGKIDRDWGKLAKIKALYSPEGIPAKDEHIIVAPYTAGPVICISRRIVSLMEHIGDDLDFMYILHGLGIQIHADVRIQYEWA